MENKNVPSQIWSMFITSVVLSNLFHVATTNVMYKTKTEAGNLLQYRSGDILLAGLMRVHRRGNEACSKIQEDGIQAVETMNMIIDQVNRNTKILPKIRLGTIMVDTCDVDSHALKRVVVDILPLLWNVSIQSTSSSEERPQVATSLIAGVVGSASSAVSIQVANLLQVFQIPQVSYWSTSPDLSNKARYKYFFRTVPSDTNQAKAMIAVAKQLGWNYISVVYEDDFYGVRGYTEVKETAEKENICIAISQPVPRNPTKADFKNIVKNLISKVSRAIIVFTKRNDASELMIAAQEFGGVANEFIWIGSDGWSGQLPMSENDEFNEDILDGSIGFTPKTSHLKGFDEYFTNITLSQNKGNFRNPWFAEYISEKNGCSLKSVSDLRICTPGESVNRSGFVHMTKMESVANAVYSFVYALDQYHKDKCGGKPGLCKAMSKLSGTNLLATGLYDYLRNLTFKGFNGNMVEFDEQQDGPAVYNILNYKRKERTRLGSKLEKWVQAGVFKLGNVSWNEELASKIYTTESVCAKPCEVGEARIEGTEICCWHCQKCRKDEYVSENGTACLKCMLGTKPNEDTTSCVPLPISEVSYESIYGIACICVGAVGLVLTLIVTAIYIVYRETAIVKASGRELCFFVLVGVFLTFLNFLSLTASPTITTCVVSRVLLAMGPTCMYAGLLTKTLRVVIIFQSKAILSQRVKMFIRPWPQILWTTGLVLLQTVVLVAWFIISKPSVEILYPTPEIAFYACEHLVDIPILIGLIYPFLLIIICTVFATVNRNVPTGFNETQYIGFSMYTTCVIWLAFLPIFITNSSDLAQRIMTTSVCLSLSAATVLICLFGPRCFTILFYPEQNTQQSVMSGSVDKGGVPGSAPALSSLKERSKTANTSTNNNKTTTPKNDHEKNHVSGEMKNGYSMSESTGKSPNGYYNGALDVCSETDSPVYKAGYLPESLEAQISGGEDTRF
ncbi:metabotropic glutamate receptor 4-like [Styela clava]